MSEKDQWFVRKNQKAFGPYSSKQLKQLVAKGEIEEQTELRRGDKQNWIPAVKVKGLLHNNSSPPPAPEINVDESLAAPRRRTNRPSRSRKPGPVILTGIAAFTVVVVLVGVVYLLSQPFKTDNTPTEASNSPPPASTDEGESPTDQSKPKTVDSRSLPNADTLPPLNPVECSFTATVGENATPCKEGHIFLWVHCEWTTHSLDEMRAGNNISIGTEKASLFTKEGQEIDPSGNALLQGEHELEINGFAWAFEIPLDTVTNLGAYNISIQNSSPVPVNPTLRPCEFVEGQPIALRWNGAELYGGSGARGEPRLLVRFGDLKDWHIEISGDDGDRFLLVGIGLPYRWTPQAYEIRDNLDNLLYKPEINQEVEASPGVKTTSGVRFFLNSQDTGNDLRTSFDNEFPEWVVENRIDPCLDVIPGMDAVALNQCSFEGKCAPGLTLRSVNVRFRISAIDAVSLGLGDPQVPVRQNVKNLVNPELAEASLIAGENARPKPITVVLFAGKQRTQATVQIPDSVIRTLESSDVAIYLAWNTSEPIDVDADTAIFVVFSAHDDEAPIAIVGHPLYSNVELSDNLIEPIREPAFFELPGK